MELPRKLLKANWIILRCDTGRGVDPFALSRRPVRGNRCCPRPARAVAEIRGFPSPSSSAALSSSAPGPK